MSARRLAASFAALLCLVAGAARPQTPTPDDAPIPTAELSPIEDGRLLVFRSPRVKAVEVESPRVDFSRSTKGGMLVMMRETYVVTIATDGGTIGRILVMVNATANTERPFADESEAEVRDDVKKSAKYNPAYADAVQVGGAWFELSGYAPRPGDVWSSANLFGHRNGISYMLMASFLAERTPDAEVRAVLESVEFAASPVREDVAIYRDFLARAVSPSGLASQFGPLPIARSKRFTLDSLTPVPTMDGAGNPGAASYHRAEYERYGGDGWVSLLCLPDDGLGRDRLERALLSGDVISDVQAQPSLDTSVGEIRRKTFRRRALGGGSVPARAWTAYRDGVLFEITTDSAPTGADAEAIEAMLSDPSRRCEPLKAPGTAPMPAATPASTP
jgi:hypothetical protein